MGLKIASFVALVFTALALGAALAYLYELPNKITLSREDYLTVQQIYRGWALLGIIEFASLFSVLTLAIMVRKSPDFYLDSDRNRVRCGNSGCVLCFYLPSESRYKRLDDSAGKLAGIACAVGVFACNKSRSSFDCFCYSGFICSYER
ncbi:hypothetical protein [Nitrosomonas sp. Nm33]|uniref:hypothetical protein n=1 Tax=Nitrosomonas sp. Nm33 TaxID=133724 RepID=UPI0008972EE1|nr:hypothetical protein [Nitrosomonas sp. Nm33]SDY31943.1 hypothetical protein SAMN05421755_10161 [Nitrosomonas sp. Nm33]